MGLIYLVRKKKFRTAEGIRELYFAIQRKLQKRGGKNEEDLAEILSANSSRSKGEVLSILTDLPDVIEEILKNGESVSRGFAILLFPYFSRYTNHSLHLVLNLFPFYLFLVTFVRNRIRVAQLVHDELHNWYTTSCTTGISYPLKESKLARNITWNSLEKY